MSHEAFRFGEIADYNIVCGAGENTKEIPSGAH